MIPAAGVAGARIGVFGLGRSGLAAARAIAAGGGTPVCGDDRAAAREAARGLGFETADLSDAAAVRDLDRLLLSPGAAHLYPAPHPAAATAAALGVPLDNDVGLFFATLEAFAPEARVAAITGSNGKSTTAALLHHLLLESGAEAQLGGNIGRGVFDLDPPSAPSGAGAIFVLELSSYQTDLASRLAPDVAILTNLTPDHLDRHGGLGGYLAAKRRLFTDRAPMLSLIGVDEPEGRFLAQTLPRPTTGAVRRVSVAAPLSGDPAAIIAEDGALSLRGAPDGTEWRFDLSALTRLPGRHNHQNIAHAAAAAAHLGATREAIRAGLESFPGLDHRLQTVTVKNGVTYVNDSKATNAEAAEQALSAYPDARWIAGGRAKEGGIDRLKPLFPMLTKAYLIGESAEAFASAIQPAAPTELCATLAQAVARAAAEARPGETVLLSPAAASFDQFESFEARGRAFAAAVEAIAPAP
ncbi:MAG: UDP-N-acetylmuramoyl-L-alanine--D-glutamate ligase [Pseudomonadota bacterium]